MSRDTRTPVSVTQIGRVTVRIYDTEAYAENIKRYYAKDVPTTTTGEVYPRPYEKKKPAARYNWTQWRGGPMIKEGA